MPLESYTADDLEQHASKTTREHLPNYLKNVGSVGRVYTSRHTLPGGVGEWRQVPIRDFFLLSL